MKYGEIEITKCCECPHSNISNSQIFGLDNYQVLCKLTAVHLVDTKKIHIEEMSMLQFTEGPIPDFCPLKKEALEKT